jgi:hypothetical protein
LPENNIHIFGFVYLHNLEIHPSTYHVNLTRELGMLDNKWVFIGRPDCFYSGIPMEF